MKNHLNKMPLAIFALGLCASMPLLAQQTNRGQNQRGGQNAPQFRNDERCGPGARELMVLQSVGYNNSNLLTAISTYLHNRDVARENLDEMARSIHDSFEGRQNGNGSAILADFEKALATERQRTWNAEKQLDAQIGYSKDAKLRGVLILEGVIGDVRNYLRPPGRPGRGGPNGMHGGPSRGGAGRGGPGREMDNFGGPPMDDLGAAFGERQGGSEGPRGMGGGGRRY